MHAVSAFAERGNQNERFCQKIGVRDRFVRLGEIRTVNRQAPIFVSGPTGGTAPLLTPRSGATRPLRCVPRLTPIGLRRGLLSFALRARQRISCLSGSAVDPSAFGLGGGSFTLRARQWIFRLSSSAADPRLSVSQLYFGLPMNRRALELWIRQVALAPLVRRSAPLLFFLASFWRRLLFRTTFIAVTGSVGKTTTKEFLADILTLKGRTFRSLGRQNGQFVLPLNILRVRPWHRFAVIEVAVNKPGSMRPLAQVVQARISGADPGCSAHAHDGVSRPRSKLRMRRPSCSNRWLLEASPFSMATTPEWRKWA